MDPAQLRTSPIGTALPVLTQPTGDRLGDELITVFAGERWMASRLGEPATC